MLHITFNKLPLGAEQEMLPGQIGHLVQQSHNPGVDRENRMLRRTGKIHCGPTSGMKALDKATRHSS